jgi:hypothetical protein
MSSPVMGEIIACGSTSDSIFLQFAGLLSRAAELPSNEL